ncbi:MAG TPA: hypothetical protein VK448_07185 [Dissulfurispiraceae bacterium]|nr:hypothetical protein [Dissulfurispiraceae bacterium]
MRSPGRQRGAFQENIRLCFDRYFSGAISRKYLIRRRVYAFAPALTFRKKAGRGFSLKTDFFVSVALRMMRRYSFQNTILFQVKEGAAGRSVEIPAAYSRISHHAIQITNRAVFNSFDLAAVPSQAKSGRIASVTLTKIHPSGVGQGQTAIRERSRGRKAAGPSQQQYKSIHSERNMFSSSAMSLHYRGAEFIERIFNRAEMQKERVTNRYAAAPSARLMTTGIGLSSSRSEQAGVSVAPAERRIVFQLDGRVRQEVKEMKSFVRKTEERVREDVISRIREITSERGQAVDVGQLTNQVCRNIERMIRSERERRGM